MTPRALAWRTVTADRARAALAIAGVAVIGALLFDMLMLSRGLLVSFRTLLDAAGYDVRVSATDGLALRVPLRHATAIAGDIALLPEIQEVAVVRRDRATASVEGRRPLRISLQSVSPGAEQQAWHIVAGTGLRSDGRASDDHPPLIVSQRLARALAASPGSTVRVRMTPTDAPSALPTLAFRVVGVASFEFETSDELVASTTLAGFERVQGTGSTDEADVLLVRSRPESGPAATVAAIERRRPDVHAFSNEQIVAQVNENGFSYFRQISFVLTSITLAFAFLLVATLLTVSVNQRLGQVAALRALGLPRRRIASTLLWESAFMVGTGALLSIPIGYALATILDRILREMPGIPERVHFFVLEPRAAIWHLALLAFTGAAAAAYPVWIATRLPIAATLRLETM
jgi:putative ABC transport system permease protein